MYSWTRHSPCLKLFSSINPTCFCQTYKSSTWPSSFNRFWWLHLTQSGSVKALIFGLRLAMGHILFLRLGGWGRWGWTRARALLLTFPKKEKWYIQNPSCPTVYQAGQMNTNVLYTSDGLKQNKEQDSFTYFDFLWHLEDFSTDLSLLESGESPVSLPRSGL